MNNLKAGQRIHNGSLIPTNARVQTRNNRECYISGLSNNNVNIKYIDDGSFEAIPWNEGEMYLPFCEVNEPIKKKK